MYFYNDWALRILSGNWTDYFAFYGLPLYAYLLAAIYKICGYNPFFAGLLQAVLEAGSAVLLYKLGSRAFASEESVAAASRSSFIPGQGKLIGLLAAIGWGFFLPAQAYSVILMPTAWLVFVFWFIVWQILKHNEAPPRRRLLLLGSLVGFAAIGVATILFLIPLLVAALFLRWRATLRSRLIGGTLVLIGVFLGASPAWIHNCFIAEDPVFLSAHSGINFWVGNNPLASGYPKFPPGLHAGQQALLQDSITVAEKVATRPLKRSEVSAYWSRQAWDWIHHHPADWLKLLGLKIKNFWSAFRYDDLSIVTALRDQSIIFPGMNFGLIAALGLPGLLIAWRKLPTSRWIAAAIFLHMAALLTVFVTERYRLAAAPGLLLFSAYGVCNLWRNIAAGVWHAAIFFLLLLFPATVFVSLPQRDPTLWALDTYNSALQALDTGQLSLAQDKLDLAYAYSPLNAEINFAEGNLRLALHDRAAAKSFYLATLRLDPVHSGAYNNLGVMALEENRCDLAVRFFEHAIELTPNDAKAYYLLAKAHLNGGNLQKARSEINEAIIREPNRPEFRALRAELFRDGSPPLEH